MDSSIFIDYSDKKIDPFGGTVYSNLIDYAFEESDYFMLVYVNYYGKGYTRIMKDFKNALKPYMVKSRSNPSWPGTPDTFCPNTTYKICFYRNDPAAKDILKKADSLSVWTRPLYPQDLAFFRGNICWFYSVGHEKLADFINPTEKDLCFIEENKIASRSDLYFYKDYNYSSYNEKII